MTDPVILLGTQSNGETLPVQVNSFGQLVAEGLQGPEGPPGVGQLPPDPYEGALLGWLDGGLAWVGTPPVPIPPGVFGPITAWDAQSGLLTIDGEIPAAVGNGVYVWQCNQDGTYFTEGWNVSQVWFEGSSFSINNPYDNSNTYNYPPAVFDGTTVNRGIWTTEGGNFTWDYSLGILVNEKIEIYSSNYNSSSSITVQTDSGSIPVTQTDNTSGWKWRTLQVNGSNLKGIFFKLTVSASGNSGATLAAVRIDDQMLVDSGLSLNMRVNNVLGQALLGVPNQSVDFTIGKYLRVPEQRVAPWVLYGNDPTSLIDHLRSS